MCGRKHFCKFGLSEETCVSFQSSAWWCASNVRNLTVLNDELGNWQVTFVCDMTSPLATLGSVHAGV